MHYMILLSLQDVANAVGAALGTVGGSIDYIVNLAEIKAELKVGDEETAAELERRARDVALERGRENAKSIVINKKGNKSLISF